MPRPPIDLKAKINEILDHIGPMPEEAGTPLGHYRFAANATTNMRKYLVRPFESVEHKAAVRERHLYLLNNMVLVNLIQAFERFIKDLAAVCVDHLSDRVFDNRFDDLSVRGSFLAAHLSDSTAGKALCESDTWLNCGQINERFKKFLRRPDHPNDAFHTFPDNHDETRTMNLIWQLRHTVVHNVTVITRSDAAKIKVLSKKQLVSPCRLLPQADDLRFLRAYLDTRAEDLNTKIGTRLGVVLGEIHADNPALFVTQDEANAVSAKFGFSITIAGAIGVAPPP
jgi:hypothetical protein